MYTILEGCPRCRQYPLRISRMRGPLEYLRHWLTRRRPFRCLACHWRGWAHESWERRKRTEPDGVKLGRRASDRQIAIEPERPPTFFNV